MNKSSCKKPVASISVLLAASLLVTGGELLYEPGAPAGIRLPAKVRGEAAIAALGARLPEVAAFYRKSPQQLRSILRADETLWVDPAGALFFACPPHCAHCAEAETAEGQAVAEIEPTDPGPFDTNEAFLLHSRPGAKRVIYLDFDGHVDDTPGNWKDGASAPPYNIPNSDPGTFSTDERNRIIEIWQRVAEDYSMYEINVTTEEPNIEALRKTSSGDAAYGIRVCIGGSGNDWYGSNVGGVAFVGSFDARNDVPCWVFPAGSGYSAKNIAEAASHEAGHTLGLLHDGIDGGASYYSGQGNWAPIMGVSYNKPISQWSKGEYTNPSNTQDDLAVMLTQGAVYRPDDHGGTIASATELSADSDTASAGGVIERSTDLDFFRIEALGGSLVVKVDPTPRGPNLRLEVKLYDAGGKLLQTATSADTMDGTQPVTLSRTVAAGIHHVSVDGIGNGNPLTTGYSDYASLGQYHLVISGVAPDGSTWLPVAAGAYQWTGASNWASGSAPNGAATTVRINNDISGNQTIQLSSTTTLGSLVLGDSNNTHAFTLAPTGGSMVFDNSGSASSLSKTTGSNDLISAPVSLVGQLNLNQSASGTLGFTGGISGAGSLNKTGAGIVVFGSANTYTGATTLSDGLLRLDDSDGIPGGIDNAVGAGESAMAFKGGVLGLASGDFTRQIGTGAGRLNWDPDTGGAGSGGFAAFGADRQVKLNNGTGAFSWQTALIGPNNILILGHPTATHTIDFKNGISFAGSKRTIQVEDGEASVDAILSGVLSGGGSSGFNKTGPGVLSLAKANTYTGATTVAGGVLRLQQADALPSGNLELTGGILGLGAGDLVNRTLGSGVDQLRWTGEGGFAAFGADRAVRFTPDPNTSINWNTTDFIRAGQALILGHDSADATLVWQQRISLAGSTRLIQVEDGAAMIDAKMSAIVAGGSSGGTNNIFNKIGAGTLAFTAQHNYWGNTIVSAGTLMIGDGGSSGGISMNSPEIIVEAGATVAVNRNDTITQGSSSALKVAISGDGGFTQLGTGNTVLTLANSYSGPTTIDGGVLTLGDSGVLPDSTTVSMGNATLDAGSFTEVMGSLDVTGAAVIDLDVAAALSFADSSAVDWSGTLDLTGSFVPGASLRFGSDGGGLSPSQLALISADGFTNFALDGKGYLIAAATSGFELWIAGNFANGSIPIDLRGPNDDFDNDGVLNLVEYALDRQDPTVPEPQVGTFTGNTLIFTKRPAANGLIYAIETSADLGQIDPWTEVTGGSYVNNPTTISYTLQSGPPRAFLRLRVSSD